VIFAWDDIFIGTSSGCGCSVSANAALISYSWFPSQAAHTFGWCAKMIMLRDWRLCWILGILWEVLEYSFQHILPNFHECWWGTYGLQGCLINESPFKLIN